jgi:hypothetical protein
MKLLKQKIMKTKIENKKELTKCIVGLVFIIFLISVMVKYCSPGERKYVFFGEDGYTQYNVIGNDSIRSILYNNGCKPYYIATIINVSNYSFFEEVFLLKHDSFVFNEIQVNPGDTVILKKHEEITDRWKYVDECGHQIPFNNIHCVGYFEKSEFHKY